MKKILATLMTLTVVFSIFSIFTLQVEAQAVALPWRDDFDYNNLDEMKTAGWTLTGEERITVGGGILTFNNTASIHYMRGFPPDIYNFSVETKSRWIGRDRGYDGNFYVYTQRHWYAWFGDGFYPEYAFVRDGTRVLQFEGYTPVKGVWTNFTLEKKGNTFYMYQDRELKNIYTDPDEAPDELVRVDISCGPSSVMEYDHISVEVPSARAPSLNLIPDVGFSSTTVKAQDSQPIQM